MPTMPHFPSVKEGKHKYAIFCLSVVQLPEGNAANVQCSIFSMARPVLLTLLFCACVTVREKREGGGGLRQTPYEPPLSPAVIYILLFYFLIWPSFSLPFHSFPHSHLLLLLLSLLLFSPILSPSPFSLHQGREEEET